MGVAASDAAGKAMAANHASAESLVIGPVRTPKEPMVIFYRLARKFVDDERSVPSDADTTNIMYYTLAVGHHTGVIDCFDECLSCTVPVYEAVCAELEEGSHARYKLEGVLRSGEIQVLQEDAPELSEAAHAALEDSADSPAKDWLRQFAELLDEMGRTKSLYLMGRKRLP
jgi:hypothetical protein